ILLAILTELASPAMRRQVLARVRQMVATNSETELRARTSAAAVIVDQTCGAQGFRFRASLVLLSMAASELALGTFDFLVQRLQLEFTVVTVLCLGELHIRSLRLLLIPSRLRF